MSSKENVGQLNVLYFEDDGLIRQLITGVITRDGHRCDSFETNKDFSPALALQRGYDAVISDGDIYGGTHGKDWLRNLGALDPKIPRVLMSGNVLERDLPELLKEGIIGFGKPIDIPRFNGLLAQLHMEKLKRLGSETRGDMRNGVFIPQDISQHESFATA